MLLNDNFFTKPFVGCFQNKRHSNKELTYTINTKFNRAKTTGSKSVKIKI